METNFKNEWYQNGMLLMQICDEGLYKDEKIIDESGHKKQKYETFESYLNDRFDMTEKTANEMIAKALSEYRYQEAIKTSI